MHARLQNLLQHLPEAAEPVAPETSASGSLPAASQLCLVPVVDPLVGKTHRETQSGATEKQADQDIDQRAADALSPAVATTPESSPKHTQPTGPEADEAATAVEAAATAEATQSAVPFTVPVVCGSMQGTYQAKQGIVHLNGGRHRRPSRLEIMAGKGDGKTWACTINVDEGNGVVGMSLGKWIKGYQQACRKSPHAKPKIAPAQRAEQGPSSAVVMADGTVQLADQDASKPQSSLAAPAAAKSVLKHVRAAASLQILPVHHDDVYLPFIHCFGTSMVGSCSSRVSRMSMSCD